MPENAAQKNRFGPAGPGILALVILASFFMLPLVGPFLILVLPVPLATARIKYGTLNFALAAVLCVALTFAGDGFPPVTAFVLGLCITGYVLGGSLMKAEPCDRAIIKGALAPLIVVGPLIGLYFYLSGINPWTRLDATLEQGMKESVILYRQMGMSQADIDALMPSLKLFKAVVMDYLPALIAGLAAFVSFVGFVLLRLRAIRTAEKLSPTGTAAQGTPQEARMNRWAAPDYAVWGVIVPGFLLIPDVPVLRQAAGNLLAVFGLVYMFQGVAVTSFVFERLKLSAFMRGLGWLLIALQPVLALVVWAVGLSDTWVDFRKLRPKAKKM